MDQVAMCSMDFDNLITRLRGPFGSISEVFHDLLYLRCAQNFRRIFIFMIWNVTGRDRLPAMLFIGSKLISTDPGLIRAGLSACMCKLYPRNTSLLFNERRNLAVFFNMLIFPNP